jgi:hypothetical protein
MSIKPFKYLSVLLLAIVITTVGLACSGTGASLSADQVMENAVAAQADVESFRLDATLTASVEDPEAGTTTVSLDADCAVDLEDAEIEAIADLSLDMTGMNIAAEIEAYVVDNYAYMMMSLMGQTTWTKQPVPADIWETVEGSQSQLEGLLGSVDAEVVKEEKVNGVNCYVVEIAPDLGQLQQALMDQPGLGEDLGEMPDLESMVEELSFKLWVAKDTYFLSKAKINITLNMADETAGIPAGTVDLSLEIVAYDYNQSISIELPPGAESAEEGSSGFELPFF